MSAPIIAFFNNKGGVGKTSLAYHLAWMYAELDYRVVVADFDPQANLTAEFLQEDELERLWSVSQPRQTVFGAIAPVIDRSGPTAPQPLTLVDERLALVPGDLDLSTFEAELSSAWPESLSRNVGAFRVLSAFTTIISAASKDHGADLVLVDLGPNLGAINRSVLISCDYLVIPLAPDLFSLQGLRNLGPTLRTWRRDWRDRLQRRPETDIELPTGRIEPLGYVMFQHRERVGRPTRAYARWAERIPDVYGREILGDDGPFPTNVDDDPACLARLKHYASLMPMAQDARKPVFELKPSDGAFGGHARAVRDSYRDFERLARRILGRIDARRPDKPPLA